MASGRLAGRGSTDCAFRNQSLAWTGSRLVSLGLAWYDAVFVSSLACGKEREQARRHRRRQQRVFLFSSSRLSRLLGTRPDISGLHTARFGISMEKTAFPNCCHPHPPASSSATAAACLPAHPVTPPRGSSSRRLSETRAKTGLGRRITRGRPQPAAQGSSDALSGSRGPTLLVLQVAARRCKTQRPRRHRGGSPVPLRGRKQKRFEGGVGQPSVVAVGGRVEPRDRRPASHSSRGNSRIVLQIVQHSMSCCTNQ